MISHDLLERKQALLIVLVILVVAIEAKMRALRLVGVPYTDEQISTARDEVAGKTEMDALIAYLQNLGTANKRGN
jgi:cbb3-type cytochrome oxidase cytochrome c subunit